MPSFDFGALGAEHTGWLIGGLWLSLRLAAIVFVLSLPLAAGIALLRLSPSRALRAAGWGYVEAVRNVPLLVHLLFWYFGAPELLPELWRERLYADVDVEVGSAVIALTLYTAAYMSEDMRSGIRAVPAAQFQAARALGLGYLAAMRWVVLPQALRVTVPPLISQTLNLWKDTSVATVIGVAELMYQAARVEAASFRSVEAFAFATAAYLAVSIAITALAAWHHRRHPVRTR